MSGSQNTCHPTRRLLVGEADVVDEIYELEARVADAMVELVSEARLLMEQGRIDEALALIRSSGGRITFPRIGAS
jgi:hypothetical protein